MGQVKGLANEMIAIYRDIDHVCRKHWLMEHMPQATK